MTQVACFYNNAPYAQLEARTRRRSKMSALHDSSSIQIDAEKGINKADVDPKPLRSRGQKSRHKRNTSLDDEDSEPLIDTTARLTLHSKKTARKNKKRSSRSSNGGLLNLPLEILCDIIAYLRPIEIAHLRQINRSAQSTIQENQEYLVTSLIKRRYTVLSRCFPVPKLLKTVDEKYHGLLTSVEHQRLLVIHEKPYQHIATPNHWITCSCITCVLAWNNLCLVVDLGHWQDYLDRREPIPQFARGAALKEQWNLDVLEKQDWLVFKACTDSLVHVHLLDKHLNTITRTLSRPVKAGHPRPYENTETDLSSGNDAFLERKGPSSYEFPFHRDIYYGLEAYVPNRRWDREERKWLYPTGNQHQFDLDWIRRRAEVRAEAEAKAEAAKSVTT